MHIKKSFSSKRYLPYIIYLLLAASVFITNDSDQQYLMLAVFMLILPTLDSEWQAPTPTSGFSKKYILLWGAMILFAMVIIILKPALLLFFFTTLIFVALPEEWFFRAYLMGRIGNGLKANLIASICFAALHAITLNWISSILVFVPSLLFGWIYQKQRNIITLTLIHSISNLVYTAYLYRYFERFYYL